MVSYLVGLLLGWSLIWLVSYLDGLLFGWSLTWYGLLLGQSLIWAVSYYVFSDGPLLYSQQLFVAKTKLNIGSKHTFYVATPTIWNQLPISNSLYNHLKVLSHLVTICINLFEIPFPRKPSAAPFTNDDSCWSLAIITPGGYSVLVL